MTGPVDDVSRGVRRALALAVAVCAAATVTACSPGADGPTAAAQRFLDAVAAGDTAGAAALSDRPDDARGALDSAWSSLQAETLVATAGESRGSGDTATVEYTYEWHLPKDRVWTYTGEMRMARSGGDWQVRWSATDLHPRLGDTQRMELRATTPPRARVNERSGSDVLVPGIVHRIRFDASAADDVVASARALTDALRPFEPDLTVQGLVESATGTGGDYLVMRLRDDDYATVEGVLAAIPGVSVGDEADLVSTDRAFAPDLVDQVKKAVVDEVDGTAGWSVVTVNRNGADVGVLTETPPEPAPSFSISLDRRVQIAAQAAVDARVEQAMTVVVQPSTGDVLAVAQNEAADRDGPVATTGLYPPGSTFKMITAAAAMESGLAGPDSPVPCPGSIVIGERSVPNYNGFSLGTVPMATAFARSCNTTFAKLASEMAADDLTRAAAQFGIGPEYDVVGVPVSAGSVPPAPDLVQRTEDGFGQGRVLVSPMGMAMAAATVAHGSAPTPRLLVGAETAVAGERPPVDPETIEGLRAMMRLVVTSGTADRIADQGEVYGKTGEAEVEGGSHAWFVGYRGDLAFATLVVRGGSSDNAVAVTRQMFDGLPPDY
ncbi:penicillin-binding transpeptidase domain-containing protein [Rhodococcus rhodnii]|uniref:Penicillin-binding protein n=2 Tax=Rhodococcus rhodnii TaxID=38312 RepID=R7WL36_9NOCA|nr:penicillin-binding transpeptidase domain-containing protein [Rhodococcus rhodnii]EOM76012.1 penicillin-binding protein [Rhodococcus rhodnii LMG 5362]TXG90851.1 penicillin-binding transpeptidase domain-containing protein [Rhodococcus rhodnii]